MDHNYQIRIGDRRPSGCLPVALRGDIDLAARDDLVAALEKALFTAQPGDHLEIDLADVAFLDCCVVGALIYARSRARQTGADLYLTGAHGVPQLVLQTLGVLTSLTERRVIPVNRDARGGKRLGSASLKSDCR